jgi:hypothetical protein
VEQGINWAAKLDSIKDLQKQKKESDKEINTNKHEQKVQTCEEEISDPKVTKAINDIERDPRMALLPEYIREKVIFILQVLCVLFLFSFFFFVCFLSLVVYGSEMCTSQTHFTSGSRSVRFQDVRRQQAREGIHITVETCFLIHHSLSSQSLYFLLLFVFVFIVSSSSSCVLLVLWCISSARYSSFVCAYALLHVCLRLCTYALSCSKRSRGTRSSHMCATLISH